MRRMTAMSDLTFPSQRLSAAGATSAEVAQLQREFDSSDLNVQKGIDEFYRGQSEGGLRDQLSQLRERGHFKGTPAEIVTTEVEVDGTTPEAVNDASVIDEDDQTEPE